MGASRDFLTFFPAHLWRSDPPTDFDANGSNDVHSRKDDTFASFQDIPPQTSCALRHKLNRHSACAILRAVYPYAKFEYMFQFLNPTLPIHYATPSAKICKNFDLLGALKIRRYEKLRFLLQKAHPCANPRRLSHFA